MEHASPLRPGLVSTPVSHDALVDGVRRLARSSVMVVGDAMLDRYIFGEARRISREAPVPVLQIDREVAVAGGAASLVRALTALGTARAEEVKPTDEGKGAEFKGKTFEIWEPAAGAKHLEAARLRRRQAMAGTPAGVAA